LIGVISGKAGKALSGSGDAATSSIVALGLKDRITLEIDLAMWTAKIRTRKTPFEITGGWGLQAGVNKFGGGGGCSGCSQPNTHKTKSYGVYSGSVGASRSKVSFSVSTAEHPCGAWTPLCA